MVEREWSWYIFKVEYSRFGGCLNVEKEIGKGSCDEDTRVSGLKIWLHVGIYWGEEVKWRNAWWLWEGYIQKLSLGHTNFENTKTYPNGEVRYTVGLWLQKL